MFLGIIGLGVVGKAVYDFFKEFDDVKIKIFDKDVNRNFQKFILEDLMDCEILFLCLPTPNDCDLRAIHEICQELNLLNFKGYCLLKSTVPPKTTRSLIENYKLNIIHNPEFLSQKTASLDFKNQNNIILGIDNINTNTDIIKNFYKKYFPNASINIVDSVVSESTKLFCNNFYAVKVQFFTEIYLLCEKLDIDYNTVKNLMISNNWINPMHTQIPGPDGKLSFGGMCFPKDTKALLKFMKSINTPCDIIEACVNEREKLRDDD